MQISDTQVKKVQELLAEQALAAEIQAMDLPLETYPRPEDAELMENVKELVLQTPDREDRIAELKARIEAGNYAPTGAEIADAMIRRSIADQIR